MDFDRFEIIPSRHWLRDDGLSASIYGACPWVSDAEKPRWEIKNAGWTIRDNKRGTVGLGQKPFETYAQAEEKLAKLKSLYA